MSDIYYYRALAYKLFKEYPELELVFDEEKSIFSKFSVPNNIFITKTDNDFFAIFTSKEFAKISTIDKHSGLRENHQPLYIGYKVYHEFSSMQEALFPYFDRIHVSRYLINKFARQYKSYSDRDNFGNNIIEVINKFIYEAIHNNKKHTKITLLNDDDLAIFGTNLFSSIADIVAIAVFDRDSKYILENQYEFYISEWGEEMVEMIRKRAEIFNSLINDHFNDAEKMEIILKGFEIR
jgi:hypothetical protein